MFIYLARSPIIIIEILFYRVFHLKKEKKKKKEKLVHHSLSLKLTIIVEIMSKEQCSTQAATLIREGAERERKRFGNYHRYSNVSNAHSI